MHFSGTAPSGRHEDYHGVHLVFAATVPADAEPHVVEVGGTTDAVAWVPVAEIDRRRARRSSTWSGTHSPSEPRLGWVP